MYTCSFCCSVFLCVCLLGGGGGGGGRVCGIGNRGISFAVYLIQLISGKGIGGWFCCSNTVSVSGVMDV